MCAVIQQVLTSIQGPIASTLELFGSLQGYPAMSKAVGNTYGITAQMLLDGYEHLNQPGEFASYKKEPCDPIRIKLEAEGIKLVV